MPIIRAAATRVHFAYPSRLPLKPYERAFIPAIQSWFAEAARRDRRWSRYQLSYSPEEADLIVLVESNLHKTKDHLAAMRAEPLPRRYPNRCFTINYEDSPAGFLPGLYTSLPRIRYDPARHRTWGYLFPVNPEAVDADPQRVTRPSLLFSFRGADSHPVRRQLFRMGLDRLHRCRITHVKRWFNHTADERQAYVDEILDSRFVLCPRGASCSSYRLFEVMSLGRCPVILADDWVPSEGIDWSACSIRLAESKVDQLGALLEDRRGNWAELGANAYRVWQTRFSPANRFGAALAMIEQLKADRPSDHDERACQRQWSSRAFQWANGWTLEQRLVNGARHYLARGKAWIGRDPA